MTPRFDPRWLRRGLLTFGLLMLALWSRTEVESQGYQSAESRRLDIALRAAESGRVVSAAQGADFPGAGVSGPSELDSDEGAVLGRIEIPRLGIAAIVAEGVDSRTLGRAVGHVPFSAQPGKQGNCALAGHRDTFMRGLGGVRAADVIRIITLGGTYTYRVEWSEVVEPERVDVLDATAAPSLTLVTCYPFAFVGRAPQRFVVRAQMVAPDAERGVDSQGPDASVATLSTPGRLK